MVKSEAHLTIYEVDGKDTQVSAPMLKVTSHWNVSRLVVLKSPGDGESITVAADELLDAVRRCSR